MPSASPTLHAACTAARRVLLQRVLRRAGTALSVAFGAGVLAVLADRLIGPGLPRELWWTVLGSLGLAAAGWAALGAWAGRPRPLEGAITADHALRLRDALSSALQLESRAAQGDAFAQVAVQDADAVARSVPISLATPIRLDNWWVLWPALAVVAAALTTVAPMDLLTDKRVKVEAAERVAAKSQAEKALEEAARSLEEIRDLGDAEGAEGGATEDAGPAPTDGPALDDRLQALDRLREQLASGEKSPDDARAEAARELLAAADAAEEQARREASAQQSASQALSALRPEDLGDASSKARRLAEALRAGDTAAATRAASDLSEQGPSMPPEARRSEAERLAALSRQLKDLAELQRQQAQSPRDSQRELERQGVSPDEARSLAENQDPAAVEEELKKRGFDEDTARQLAEKLAAERAERQSREQAARDVNDLAEAVDRAADEAARPASPQTPVQAQPQPQPRPQPPPPQPPPRDATAPTGKPGESASPEAADPTPDNPPGTPPPRPPEPSPAANSTGTREGNPPKEAPQQPGPNTPPNIPGATTPAGAPSNQAEQKPGEQGKATPSPNQVPQQAPGQAPPSQPQGQPGQSPQQGQGPQPGPHPGGNQPDPSQPPPSQPPPSQPDSSQPPPSQPPQTQPGQPQSGQPQPGPQGQNQPAPAGQPGGEPTGQPGRQPGQPPGSGNQPGSDPQASPNAAPPPDAGTEQRSPSTAQPQDAQGSPDASRQDGPGQGRGDGAGKGGLSPTAMQALKDQIERMGQGTNDAARKTAESRRLREQAEKLLDTMSPEQRRELEQLIAQHARGGSGTNAPGSDALEGTRTTPVDLRSQGQPADPGNQEVLAEVNDPNAQGERRAPGGIGRRPQPPNAQETLRSVQRAIEEKQLPARYRNVEKYFRRAAEREQSPPAPSTETAGPAPASPVEPVKDAPDAQPTGPKP